MALEMGSFFKRRPRERRRPADEPTRAEAPARPAPRTVMIERSGRRQDDAAGRPAARLQAAVDRRQAGQYAGAGPSDPARPVLRRAGVRAAARQPDGRQRHAADRARRRHADAHPAARQGRAERGRRQPRGLCRTARQPRYACRGPRRTHQRRPAARAVVLVVRHAAAAREAARSLEGERGGCLGDHRQREGADRLRRRDQEDQRRQPAAAAAHRGDHRAQAAIRRAGARDRHRLAARHADTAARQERELDGRRHDRQCGGGADARP